MIRQKRKKKAILKKIGMILLGFVAVIAITILVSIKVCVVKNVEIEGNILYEDAVIKDAILNDEYSSNTLYVFLKYLFVDTEKIPFIDTMEVTIKNSTTLHIEVYEKTLLGYLYIPAIAENAYFDKDGLVVETSTRVIENVPLIEGIVCDEVVLYEKLPIDEERLKELLTLSQTLKRNELIPERILYGSQNEPIVIYGDIKVQLGSVRLLTQKVAHMSKILPLIQEKSGVLHLENWTEDKTNIVFKEKKQEETIATETEDSGQEETTEEHE